MRRRSVLVLSIVAVAGCTGGNNDSDSVETTSTTTGSESTSTTTTTREPCSTVFGIENPPEKPDSLSGSAESIVMDVERAVARAYFEPDGYFHFSMGRESTTEIEDGVRVDARVEVDFASSGDGENATTVEYHLFYDISYRLTDRRIQRAAAEHGETGTVVCW